MGRVEPISPGCAAPKGAPTVSLEDPASTDCTGHGQPHHWPCHARVTPPTAAPRHRDLPAPFQERRARDSGSRARTRQAPRSRSVVRANDAVARSTSQVVVRREWVADAVRDGNVVRHECCSPRATDRPRDAPIPRKRPRPNGPQTVLVTRPPRESEHGREGRAQRSNESNTAATPQSPRPAPCTPSR